MAVDPEDLLIRPFRDVVALGVVAVTNAGTGSAASTSQGGSASPDRAACMRKAAQALVREGERALAKVQLVWNDQVAKHGNGFREIIVDQGEQHDDTAGCPAF